jgi:hypothetical protein
MLGFGYITSWVCWVLGTLLSGIPSADFVQVLRSLIEPCSSCILNVCAVYLHHACKVVSVKIKTKSDSQGLL